jgi:hypothetical protein
MILNVFTIIQIFIGSLSLLLMAWAGLLGLRLALQWKRSSEPEDRASIEDGSHLVLLVAVVVLGIRLINWPLYYATLQSFVPDIEGAMCIFGVTQVERTLTGLSELFKPVSFFVIGGWFALHFLDQQTRTSALMGRKLLLLSVTAVVVVVDASLDIAQMLKIGPDRIVSCCTTVTDVLDRPTRLVPQSAFGPAYSSFLGKGYFVVNILMIVLLGLLCARVNSEGLRPWRRLVLAFVFLVALFNAALFLLSQIEVHAPQIMNLPFHHCIYCLWQYVPDTILMYAFFIVATSATGWALLLDILGRSEESMETLDRYVRRLYGLASVCYAASLIMNSVHLATA